MVIILTVLVFIILLCVVLVAFSLNEQSRQKKSLRDRLIAQGDSDGESSLQLMTGELSPTATLLSSSMRMLGIDVDKRIEALELKFSRAGIDSKSGPVYYLFFRKIISFFLAPAGLWLFLSAAGPSKLMMESSGLFLLVIALFGPQLFIKNAIDRRSKLLIRSFPDTLDLLLICVESGLALDAALARVCNELGRAHPEITAELNRLRLELALLNDRPRALMNLGERTGLVAFRSLVVALIQSERFGTALTDTLRVLSEDFRLQRLATAEEKAARLPVLLTLPLILLLMPAFFLIILGPAIISFMKNGQAVTGGK